MSEFNGKKFYGFSLHDDPALISTTRNFEFKHTRPEQLERAIQKVHLTNANSERQKKNIMLHKYCKLKKQPRDMATSIHMPDMDVDTHVSHKDESRIRTLTEIEIDRLIVKAKNCGITDGDEVVAESTVNINYKDIACGTGSGYTETAMQYPEPSDEKEVQTQLESYDDLSDEPLKCNAAVIMENAVFEPYIEPQLKWVEIEKPQSVAALKLTDVAEARPSPTTIFDVASNKLVNAANSNNVEVILTMPYDDSNPRAYYIEDSDLEYEMLERADYTKFCGSKPLEEDMVNVSNDSGGYAQFIEMEPDTQSMELSFLKNATPLRYSDLTDDIPDDENLQSSHMKVYIKGRNPDETSTVVTYNSSNEDTKIEKSTTKKKKCSKSNSPANKEYSHISPRSKYSKYTDSARISAPRSPRLHKQCERSEQGRRSRKAHHNKTGEYANMKNLILSKSLEDLKTEKIAIFTKMTSTQERIIELLDKLRMNLLEVYVPDNSYEKHKRQKNAFEFSVRFSRNFLYPLKGMIEDLRLTTVEQLNSASSNDACARIAAIYALVYQSLQTYLKQLRYFLLDQIPQKLTTLIEMIYTTTALCLDKGLFDRNDAIIDCLQERCTKFLSFIENMHEERFHTARENYRRSHVDKSHSNYNLKMFMNDLNMYEPKLVPKQQCLTQGHKRSQQRTQRKMGKNKQYSINKSSDMGVVRTAEDAISTQMQAVADNVTNVDILDSVQSFLALSNEKLREQKIEASSSNPLNKAIVEALQTVTKEQVQQVLEPIIQSLGSALNNKVDVNTLMYSLR